MPLAACCKILRGGILEVKLGSGMEGRLPSVPGSAAAGQPTLRAELNELRQLQSAHLKAVSSGLADAHVCDVLQILIGCST